jgi:mono/diheme cytochrome c family protein
VKASKRPGRRVLLGWGLGATLLAVFLGLTAAPHTVHAGLPWGSWFHPHACYDSAPYPAGEDVGGTWYWLRSPEEEKRVTASLFNRYCIRCHGVDGRGVWDIPGVPDFTNERWQACRSDGQLARIILEGRGAVMPPFRGTLSLEEAWAMARYLRSFDPANQPARPDLGKGGGQAAKPRETAPQPREQQPAEMGKPGKLP